MPIYEYACRACDNCFEKYVQAFGQGVACPSCGARDVEKLLSSFAMAASGEAPRRGAGAGGACCCGGCGCAH